MKFCHKVLETLSYHMVKTRCLYDISPGLGTTQDRITIADTSYSYASSRM